MHGDLILNATSTTELPLHSHISISAGAEMNYLPNGYLPLTSVCLYFVKNHWKRRRMNTFSRLVDLPVQKTAVFLVTIRSDVSALFVVSITI